MEELLKQMRHSAREVESHTLSAVKYACRSSVRKASFVEPTGEEQAAATSIQSVVLQRQVDEELLAQNEAAKAIQKVFRNKKKKGLTALKAKLKSHPQPQSKARAAGVAKLPVRVRNSQGAGAGAGAGARPRARPGARPGRTPSAAMSSAPASRTSSPVRKISLGEGKVKELREAARQRAAEEDSVPSPSRAVSAPPSAPRRIDLSNLSQASRPPPVSQVASDSQVALLTEPPFPKSKMVGT